MVRPLNSVAYGQRDMGPMVTFPAMEHHWPLTCAKLYCLMTRAHGCRVVMPLLHPSGSNRSNKRTKACDSSYDQSKLETPTVSSLGGMDMQNVQFYIAPVALQSIVMSMSVTLFVCLCISVFVCLLI